MNVNLISMFFVVIGAFFMLVGSIGIVRMPDIFTRMHAATKCTTLGITSLLIASFLHLGFHAVGLKAIGAIIFTFLTTPISAHLIGRAAYLRKVPLAKETCCDELKDYYAKAHYQTDCYDNI